MRQNIYRAIEELQAAPFDTEIKELRTACGMTQKAFAEYFHISKRSIESWEGGTRNVPEYLIELMEYKLRKEGLI